MKNIFFAILVTLIFYAPVHAISEAEFQRLYKSTPALQKADRLLNKTWKEVSNNIPKKDRKSLLAQQREWIRHGRDETAEDYMQEGYSKGCAYAISTMSWIKDLKVLEYNYNLSEEDKGRAKADGAFWNEEEDIPEECR